MTDRTRKAPKGPVSIEAGTRVVKRQGGGGKRTNRIIETTSDRAPIRDRPKQAHAKTPPRDFEKRATQLMIARMLFQLRTYPPMKDIKETAERLGFHPNWVRRLEAPDEGFSTSLKQLERYQDLHGMPSGVLILVAQIAEAVCLGQDGKLDALRAYCGALEKRIEAVDRAKLQHMAADFPPPSVSYDVCDKILSDLIAWLQSVTRHTEHRGQFRNWSRLREEHGGKPEGDGSGQREPTDGKSQ